MRVVPACVIFLWLTSHMLFVKSVDVKKEDKQTGYAPFETWPPSRERASQDNETSSEKEDTFEEDSNLLYDIFGIEPPKVPLSSTTSEKEGERGWTYGSQDDKRNGDNGYRENDYQKSSYTEDQFRKYPYVIGDAARSGSVGHIKLLTKKKKKDPLSKILSVRDRKRLPSEGTQMKGTFVSLEDCQRACALLPSCFAGTWDSEEQACFFHNGDYVCDTPLFGATTTLFYKILCHREIITQAGGRNVVMAHIRFGSSFPAGVPVKADNHMECLEACVDANMGPFVRGDEPNLIDILQTDKICFGFDYNFASHKCFLHLRTHYWQRNRRRRGGGRFGRRGSDGHATPICSSTSGSFLDSGFTQGAVFKKKEGVVSVLWCPA